MTITKQEREIALKDIKTIVAITNDKIEVATRHLNEATSQDDIKIISSMIANYENQIKELQEREAELLELFKTADQIEVLKKEEETKMTNLIAKVLFIKEVEQDNYEIGCHGGISTIHDESFTLEFTDKEHLIAQLAEWTASRFDVSTENFIEHTENECDNNRFDYAQAEDADGNHIAITPENPDGYYAMYFYHIEVSQKVNYSF